MKNYTVTPVDLESYFGADELLFSTTDKIGRIKSCNDIFVRVSEFSSSELLGQAHNCVRHPDMPRCIFKLFWDFLADGKIMGGYVKNMTKNGKYYWVYALVTHLEDGYLSVRIKPQTPLLATIKDLYAKLLEIEEGFGSDWRKGMEESYSALNNELKGLGFDSYDSFISETVKEEMNFRVNNCASHTEDRSQKTANELLSKVAELSQKREILKSKSQYLGAFAKELELVAINSTVRASFLGRDGAPLTIIGKEISSMSQTIKNEITHFSESSCALISDINKGAEALSVASIQNEMARLFNLSINPLDSNPEDEISEFGLSTQERSRILSESAVTYDAKALSILKNLLTSLNSFEHTIDSLSKVFQVLQFSYVAGCAEIARISQEDNFGPLFESLKNISNSGKTELRQLDSELNSMRGAIETSTNVRTMVV